MTSKNKQNLQMKFLMLLVILLDLVSCLHCICLLILSQEVKTFIDLKFLINSGNDVDEDDLLAELEAMEQETMDEAVSFVEIVIIYQR